MRKLLLFVAVGLMTVLTACGPTKEDAIKFNDEVVADQKKLLEMEEGVINAIADNAEITDVEKKYNSYLDYINSTLKKYDEMKGFDEKDTFRKAMVDLLKQFKNVAENEYKSMLNTYGKSGEELTDEDLDAWDKTIELIDEKETKANDEFLAKQKVFAEDYEFSLVEK